MSGTNMKRYLLSSVAAYLLVGIALAPGAMAQPTPTYALGSRAVTPPAGDSSTLISNTQFVVGEIVTEAARADAASATLVAAAIAIANNVTFGSGADGNVTVTGTVYLARPMRYNNLTIVGAGSVVTNGYPLQVSGVLDLSLAQAGAVSAGASSQGADANGGWYAPSPWEGGVGSTTPTSARGFWSAQGGDYPVIRGMFAAMGWIGAGGAGGISTGTL